MRRTFTTAALVALAPFGGQRALAQAELEPAASDEAQRHIVERIRDVQQREGVDSKELVVPLTELALLYERAGDTAKAIAATERVVQLVRVNDGVLSLEQAPLIEKLIALEQSAGNAAAAWDFEQRLLTLARRKPDDLRTIPILRESAERRMYLLERFYAGERPPQIELGCYGGWPRMDGTEFKPSQCSKGPRGDVARAVLSDAQRLYAEAIGVAVRNRQYGSDELRELETAILRSIPVTLDDHDRLAPLDDVNRFQEPWRSFVEAVGAVGHLDFPNPTGLTLVPSAPGRQSSREGTGFDYRLGREAQVRLYAYELATPAQLATQIEAFLRVADWDLLHSQNGVASGEYEQVRRLLLDRGLSRASIDELFSPKLPVVLPAFEPNPLASEGTGDSGAYIEVTFSITPLGEPRRVAILAADGNASQGAKERLLRTIASARYRPRTLNGKFAASPVTVRYYLNDAREDGVETGGAPRPGD